MFYANSDAVILFYAKFCSRGMFLGIFPLLVWEIQKVEFFGQTLLRRAQAYQFMCMSPMRAVQATRNRHFLLVFEVLGPVQVLCGPNF